MDQKQCEMVLWSETKQLDLESATASTFREDVLKLICRSVLETEGEGFASGEALPDSGDAVDALRKAVADVYAEMGSVPANPALLLWPSTDGIVPDSPPPHFESWAYEDSKKVRCIGPIRKKGATGVPSLYLFAALDKTMAYRDVAFATSFAPAREDLPPFRKSGLALCIVALLLFCVSSFWTIQVGNLSFKNAQEFKLLVGGGGGAALDESGKNKVNAFADKWSDKQNWLCQSGNDNGCDKWVEAGNNAKAHNKLPWLENFGYYQNGMIYYCLFIPFLVFMGSIVMMLVGSGFLVSRSVFTVFVDPESGRVSLSRLQAVAWTILLLGGYTTLVMYNIGLSAEQSLFAQLQLGIQGDNSRWKDIVDKLMIFPKMDVELWVLLGVAVGSPFMSVLITKQSALKNVNTNVQQTTTKIVKADPNWRDLFLEANDVTSGTVDLTRLQNFVFTGMLLITYFQLLFKSVYSISPAQIILATEKYSTAFSSMPLIDSSFLGLLLLSHSVYLVKKGYSMKQGNS